MYQYPSNFVANLQRFIHYGILSCPDFSLLISLNLTFNLINLMHNPHGKHFLLQFFIFIQSIKFMRFRIFWLGNFEAIIYQSHFDSYIISNFKFFFQIALMRERDELLALLDVQERQRYEATRSQSSDDSEYSSFTSTEVNNTIN